MADFRLSMIWRDYRGSRSLSFGKERPDRLLDIVDVEYKQAGEEWLGFGFRCGQALAAFLNPEGLRWIGYYSKALLQLSPYHEAFSKKLGTYWIMVGVTAGKKGLLPRATPNTILDFCGEKANWRNPGQTVDAFIQAHQQLQEIGVLKHIPILEPPTRNKGYFKKWLETTLTVELSADIWKVKAKVEEKVVPKANKQVMLVPGWLPKNPHELQQQPTTIKQFRSTYRLGQGVLAQAVGITRQTLSNYERGLRPIPSIIAEAILKIWRRKANR